ncbi:MAG TPA: NAD(P)H-dependent oxidoreductase [Hyphomonadaceae bacterium]|nr:NAD(P)H-dependent oxidoreductase [Hyphomonadaceae bacterium]HPI47835.1 NAD(P)H-dependent oxidoreductase [Hyphomonadaceae bacterium]
MTRKIAVLVGSLRKESFSRKIAKNIEALAPAGLTFEEIDISKVGHYNQDLDGNPPAEWVELRDKIKSADAVLFVTPEYNRSVPGVLKNAIDIASRPYGHSAFNGKPAAVVSNSPGNIGGFGAHHHLRQTLAFLNMPTLQQPEMYLSGVGSWFNEAGVIEKDETRKFLAQFGQTFADWIEKTAPAAK